LSGLFLLFVFCRLFGAAHGQSLGIAASAPVTSVDPHHHILAPNAAFDMHAHEPPVAFHPSCPHAMPRCSAAVPIFEAAAGYHSACHLNEVGT
jgi:hypothetical protein